jgi:hypothetical protein
MMAAPLLYACCAGMPSSRKIEQAAYHSAALRVLTAHRHPDLDKMKGRATYSRRKQIAEPVFGQIKDARGFRRFSFRGLFNVAREWDLVYAGRTTS